MNKAAVFAALLITCGTHDMSARGTWDVLGTSFSVDTLYHATVGPGTTETELRIEADVNGVHIVNNIFYTATELANPYVEMRAGKGGNHMRQLEVVPEIAERLSEPGEKYFAGVNADFFNMGYPYNPIGMCIANGFPTNYAAEGADIDPYYIYFDDKGVPSLVRHINNDWEGLATFPGGDSYGFYVNTIRHEDELILYSPQWQLCDADNNLYDVKHTGANRYGVEVSVRPVGKNVLYGNHLQLEVVSGPEEAVGNMEIPSVGYVLSAHGEARPYLRQLKKGDIVTLSIGFTASGVPVKAKELLGGYPFVLKNKVVPGFLSYPEHLRNREPRSAVGYDENKKTLYMAVVDGRNAGGSAGVTQRELGVIMRNIGCSDAMNFDGGGSSTMYVDGFGVKNVPSSSSLDKRPEGTPRTVVNGLFAVAVAPIDNVIASIELRDKKVELTTGESYIPVVYGYNQYGVLVSTDVAGCTFNVPQPIATVDGNRLVGGEGQFSGILTADYNGATCSVPVYLNGGGSFVAGVIEVITDAEVSAEYYQLNGIRVSSPVPGQVSIVKKGNQTIKQLTH